MPRPPTNDGQVRIIGGLWRGRKIHFPAVPGLRPTPNRVRETLFNWLVPVIQGAHCLDLFAGSGALSFEALSRGAAYCLALDNSPTIIDALINNKAILQAQNLAIQLANFPYSLDIVKGHFDIVFIDPPFHQGYIPQAIDWLVTSSCLKEGSMVYLEAERDEQTFTLPDHWQIKRDKVAGNVRYLLIEITCVVSLPVSGKGYER